MWNLGVTRGISWEMILPLLSIRGKKIVFFKTIFFGGKKQ
jgi:hypothetical protein